MKDRKTRKTPHENEEFNLKEEQVRSAYNGELLKAMDRIWGIPGQTPEFRSQHLMEWILKFTHTDLETISAGDWSNLRYEIAAFSEYGTPGTGLTSAENIQMGSDWQDLNLTSLDELQSNPTYVHIFEFQNLPEKNTVQELQRITLKHIEGLIIKGAAAFPLPQITIHILNIDRLGKTEIQLRDGTFKPVEIGWMKYVSASSPRESFIYYLATMLSKYAPRLRRCPGCQTVFLADRKNQEYCSTKCQSRTFMRKLRGTPPERAGKRGRPPMTVKKNEEPSKTIGGSGHGKRKRKG